MSCQRIQIFGLLNLWFTTYYLISFIFAFLELSFKFEVPRMVLTLALVSVNLIHLRFNNTWILDATKLKIKYNINRNIIDLIAKFIYEYTRYIIK